MFLKFSGVEVSYEVAWNGKTGKSTREYPQTLLWVMMKNVNTHAIKCLRLIWQLGKYCAPGNQIKVQ